MHMQDSLLDGTTMTTIAPDLRLVDPFTISSVAESAEAVVEGLSALVATRALRDLGEVVDPDEDAWPAGAGPHRAVKVDEYAKAVLYNGLGHYRAALTAAQRACDGDHFRLIEGALAELVEAAARSGHRRRAMEALQRLESRAEVVGSDWALGLAASSRALLTDDDQAETEHLRAIGLLSRARADVALGRARLVYGEWLRRRGRRVDARVQLRLAIDTFDEVGMDGFGERAGRELLATAPTSRRRSDDTRFDLTAQETRIAELASGGCTNPEIGHRLFISSRTVEWHLRKVFSKLGVSSRKELAAALVSPVSALVS